MNIQLKDVDNVVFNGIDISAVKFNDVLVWRKWETLEYTGAVPVTIYANGEPLIDLIISGNMSQSGTPSPTTPIQPQECGERTGNLFDYKTAYSAYLQPDGSLNATASQIIQVVNYFDSNLIGQTVTISVKATNVLQTRVMILTKINGVEQESNAISANNTGIMKISVTPTSTNDYWRISFGSGASLLTNYSDFMLNSGSTALPYEPYGYKLDISSGGENLFDEVYPDLEQGQAVKYKPVYVGDGNFTLSTDYPLVQAGTADLFLLPGNVSSGASTGSNGVYFGQSRTFSSVGGYMTIGYRKYSATHPLLSDYHVMLNLGSTPKPYSPYNRTTTPVYLGEVETERKIRKLVLTGEEWWGKEGGVLFYNDVIIQMPAVQYADAYCSHYRLGSSYTDVAVKEAAFGISKRPAIFIHDSRFSTAADLKAYLAQQYANGTPVCVWYVLATPTTGIVNEPLRKIGTYADSLSVSQTIPTVEGSNVVDVETTLKPSEIYLKYKGKIT